MKKVKAFVLLLLILYGGWIMLTGTDRDELIAGGLTALFISIFFSGKAAILSEIRLTPKSLLYMPLFLLFFLKELVKCNLDVAGRVISPHLPINPGIVRVKTKLQTRFGRLALANAITLTPGTMTVDTEGDTFYIHWINIQGEGIEERTANIVAGFEKYLEVIFG